MKKYAKIIDEESQLCEVGIGTNEEFYQSVGMTEQAVEQAYNGLWYIEGFAPEKPDSVKETEVRLIRNRYLGETDKYMIVDFPITDEERIQYQMYRRYLRDITATDLFPDVEVLSFETWLETSFLKDRTDRNSSESEVENV